MHGRNIIKGELSGGGGWNKRFRDTVQVNYINMLNLKCLLDILIEMLQRQLKYVSGDQGERPSLETMYFRMSSNGGGLQNHRKNESMRQRAEDTIEFFTNYLLLLPSPECFYPPHIPTLSPLIAQLVLLQTPFKSSLPYLMVLMALTRFCFLLQF